MQNADEYYEKGLKYFKDFIQSSIEKVEKDLEILSFEKNHKTKQMKIIAQNMTDMS